MALLINLHNCGLGAFILNVENFEVKPFHIKERVSQHSEDKRIPIWDMYFDGACTKYFVGGGIFFISPTNETIYLSYKLDFRVKINIEEYEALVLGLNVAKEMNI